jgi:hypothetical protein
MQSRDSGCALLPVYSILHTIYLVTGIAQLALTFALLGVLRRGAGVRIN